MLNLGFLLLFFSFPVHVLLHAQGWSGCNCHERDLCNLHQESRLSMIFSVGGLINGFIPDYFSAKNFVLKAGNLQT